MRTCCHARLGRPLCRAAGVLSHCDYWSPRPGLGRAGSRRRAATRWPPHPGPALSLAELTVLALLAERPAHGFAIARLTAPGSELGRIWQIPRPVVYRAMGRLAEAGLIAPGAVEAGRGPQRTLYAVTPAGRQTVARWLAEPVHHVREVRSHLLLKLALLDRAGQDPAGLLAGSGPSWSPSSPPSSPNSPSGPASTPRCSPGARPARPRP